MKKVRWGEEILLNRILESSAVRRGIRWMEFSLVTTNDVHSRNNKTKYTPPTKILTCTFSST